MTMVIWRVDLLRKLTYAFIEIFACQFKTRDAGDPMFIVIVDVPGQNGKFPAYVQDRQSIDRKTEGVRHDVWALTREARGH